MVDKERVNLIAAGEESYHSWRESLLSNPEYRAIYEEEAAKSDLWLQLVEARQTAGLTQKQVAERMGVSQAQVARIEKRGYDSYTLNTLRRYVKALGRRLRAGREDTAQRAVVRNGWGFDTGYGSESKRGKSPRPSEVGVSEYATSENKTSSDEATSASVSRKMLQPNTLYIGLD